MEYLTVTGNRNWNHSIAIEDDIKQGANRCVSFNDKNKLRWFVATLINRYGAKPSWMTILKKKIITSKGYYHIYTICDTHVDEMFSYATYWYGIYNSEIRRRHVRKRKWQKQPQNKGLASQMQSGNF